jgi:hypothetical protein
MTSNCPHNVRTGRNIYTVRRSSFKNAKNIDRSGGITSRLTAVRKGFCSKLQLHDDDDDNLKDILIYTGYLLSVL